MDSDGTKGQSILSSTGDNSEPFWQRKHTHTAPLQYVPAPPNVLLSLAAIKQNKKKRTETKKTKTKLFNNYLKVLDTSLLALIRSASMFNRRALHFGNWR